MNKRNRILSATFLGLSSVLAGTLSAGVAHADRVIVVPGPDVYPGPFHWGPPAWGPRDPRPWVPRPHRPPFPWTGPVTAITLKLLDNLNDEQRRVHEEALLRSTTAGVGETIIWEEGGASGSVTTTRIGHTRSGRTCHEFQQDVTIGGKTQHAYGTACQQPDGSWKIINSG